jgi:lysozyme family protein
LAQEAPHPQDWTNPSNFSNDPHDPGGATMCGIIQTEYDDWRKAHGLPVRPVRELTQEEGSAIYRGNYWMPHCPILPAGLDLQFFDSAVNQGTEEATKILQVALQISSDGDFGPLTTAACSGCEDIEGVVAAFTARRLAVYKESRGFQYFGSDWTRRATEIGNAALQACA